jgi:hypothetical protein
MRAGFPMVSGGKRLKERKRYPGKFDPILQED